MNEIVEGQNKAKNQNQLLSRTKSSFLSNFLLVIIGRSNISVRPNPNDCVGRSVVEAEPPELEG